MVATKPLEKVKAKWQSRATAAAPDYTDGVTSPKRSWSAGAVAAIPNMKAGLDQAFAAGRVAAGIRDTGDEGWKAAAIEKGSAHYADGIRIGADKYASKMSEVLSTISATTLPPRGPRGSAANYERVRKIGEALHKKFRGR